MLLPRVNSLLRHHFKHHQLPHWDALFLSIKLLSTAAAATNASGVQQQIPQAAGSSSSHRPAHQTAATSSNTLTFNNVSTKDSNTRARVLDGRAVAAAWSSELQQQVQDISRLLNRRPGLAVVLVGDRPDSLIYVSRKQEACK
jgi:hypothetical protein